MGSGDVITIPLDPTTARASSQNIPRLRASIGFTHDDLTSVIFVRENGLIPTEHLRQSPTDIRPEDTFLEGKVRETS